MRGCVLRLRHFHWRKTSIIWKCFMCGIWDPIFSRYNSVCTDPVDMIGHKHEQRSIWLSIQCCNSCSNLFMMISVRWNIYVGGSVTKTYFQIYLVNLNWKKDKNIIFRKVWSYLLTFIITFHSITKSNTPVTPTDKWGSRCAPALSCWWWRLPSPLQHRVRLQIKSR